jgi:hypothetical protein
MTMRDFEQALTDDFPQLYHRADVHANIRPGWMPIVRALSAILEPMVAMQLGAGVDPADAAAMYRISEQAGMLVVVIDGQRTEAMDRAVDDAEKAAETTCEICGSPGRLRIESETRVACDRHLPPPWQHPKTPKKTSGELVELCAEVLKHLRDTFGGDEPYYLPPFEKNGELIAVPDASEYFLVPMTALMYGAGTAFVTLMGAGLEREALQMRRSMMEYYFVSRYYAEHPQWALVALLESFDDERVLLENVIAEHGSRARLAELQRLSAALTTVLARIPKSERKHIRPSMEELAKRYARTPTDYGLHYRGPSQLTHASFTGVAFGWEGADRYLLRFDGGIANANSSASLAAEYLLAFVDVVAPHLRFITQPQTAGYARRLKQLRRRLKLRRPAA